MLMGVCKAVTCRHANEGDVSVADSKLPHRAIVVVFPPPPILKPPKGKGKAQCELNLSIWMWTWAGGWELWQCKAIVTDLLSLSPPGTTGGEARSHTHTPERTHAHDRRP